MTPAHLRRIILRQKFTTLTDIFQLFSFLARLRREVIKVGLLTSMCLSVPMYNFIKLNTEKFY